MGLDVGDKTIGVAISDELGISANPVTVIRRTGSVRKEIAEVLRLADESHVERIVIGMPLMLDGKAGIQAQKVETFVEALRRRTRIPVATWDERLTTAEAERMLIESDESRARRRKVIDKLAAALILQSYLDRMKAEARKAEVGDE
jgi:putative Holliday junction resolvase